MGGWADRRCSLECSIQNEFRTYAFREYLPRRRCVTQTQHPQPPQVDTRPAEPFSHVFDHQLSGKERLRGAETAERPVRRSVRGDRPRPDADIGTGIRTGGMNGRTRQHDGSQRAVCPTIQHDLDVLKDQCSILFEAGAVPDDSWMTLGRRREVLVPVVDQANGASSFAGEERGMNRHNRRVLLLASEPSSCFRLDHHSLLIGELQGSLQGAMDVVGALQRADDPDGAVCFRESDCALRLDIQLLLQSNAKLTLHDDLRLPLRGRHISFRYVDRAEEQGGAPDIRDRSGELVLDVDMAGRLLQRGPVMRGQQEDRFLLVPDLAPLRG